ncbi:MAG: hypothetical protein QXH90_07705 [Candidatus Korarchaeum sp.]
MPASDVIEGRLGKGAKVTLEGRVVQLLPIFSMGELVYERFLLEDDTARVTVIVPASERILLPGDEVRVEGRVRPCPYAPAANCVESRAEDVEVLRWKWVDPAQRGSWAIKGAFNVRFLLHMTNFDEEVMEGVIATELEPIRIREAFEERVSSGRGHYDLLATLSAMTMYAIFLRDLNAASTTRLSIALLESLALPDEVKVAINMLSDMLNTLTSKEGLAPYVSPPSDLRGIVDSYPTFTERDLEDVPRLKDLARGLLEDMRRSGRGYLLLEFSDREDLEETRRMAEVVAGVSQARLAMITASALAEDMGEVLSDLKGILISKQDEKLVVYLEAPELLIPNERMLEMMRVQPELRQVAASAKSEVAKILRSLMERASLIAVTSSLSMVDTEVLKGVKIASLGAGATLGGEVDYSV